ncbi:hypothetical protein UFOVP5_4 [uncultured Caudovirales phage]|uniref:Uncharacterized protein n=1 Tax=uncultured Caudovirales phage TaxID=2100421 RepID=A0A6J5KIV4_9CAUD|nr:hypothetical protein UFOVP5_4 [uncultured Caudovirales phage]
MIELVPASPAHVGVIANRMREADVIECRAMGRSPKDALRLGIKTSAEAWTAKVDGRPEAMFGLVITSALGGTATPWMLGTDAIYRHPREMICHGEKVLRRWLDSYPLLGNYVSVDNSRAIRLLRRWGCKIGWNVIMLGDTGFVSFTMER